MPEAALTLVAVEILRHLSVHPDAQDDLDGLIDFWLLERRLSETRAEVEDALQLLTSRALVEAVVGADGRVRYRRAKGS